MRFLPFPSLVLLSAASVALAAPCSSKVSGGGGGGGGAADVVHDGKSNAAFARADVDKSGTLALKEYLGYLKGMGVPVVNDTQGAREFYFKQLDKDHNGVLTKEELRLTLAARTPSYYRTNDSPANHDSVKSIEGRSALKEMQLLAPRHVSGEEAFAEATPAVLSSDNTQPPDHAKRQTMGMSKHEVLPDQDGGAADATATPDDHDPVRKDAYKKNRDDWFASADVDGSGYLTLQEYRKYLKAKGERLGDNSLSSHMRGTRFFKGHDRDNNGALTKEELWRNSE